MIGALATRVGEAWAVAAALQLVLWLVQQRTRNAGIVDVGWAASFALVIAVFALGATSPLTAWLPIACVAAAWSLRLTSYLISRGAARAPEEAATSTCASAGPLAHRADSSPSSRPRPR